MVKAKADAHGVAARCWNALCERWHRAGRRFALRTLCGTFELGARPCKLCGMVSRPGVTRCENPGRGCPGQVADFGLELADNATPGSPAFALGQQVAARVRADKQALADRRRAECADTNDRLRQAGQAGTPSASAASPRKVHRDTAARPSGRPPGWMVRPPGNYRAGVLGASRAPDAAMPCVFLARGVVCPENELGDDAWFRRGGELGRSFDAAFNQP